ncbi:MAG: polysaccharide biosynthesis C-terminal domain-containing protein [Candidatus Korarchaeota archaeon]
MGVFEEASEARVVAGGTWSMLGGMIGAFISWTFLVIASWEDIGFGKDALFYYLYYNTICGAFSLFTSGIASGLVREITAADERSPQLGKVVWIRASRLMIVIGVSLLCAIVTGTYWLLSTNRFSLGISIVFVMASISLFIQSCTIVYSNIVGAHHRFDISAKIAVLATIISYAYLYVLLVARIIAPELFYGFLSAGGYLSYAFLFPLYGIILQLSSFFLFRAFSADIRKKLPKDEGNPDMAGASSKKLLSVGILAALTTMVVYSLPFQINQFLLGVLGIPGGEISVYIISMGYAATALYAVSFIPPMIPEISRAVVRNDWTLINQISRSMIKIGATIGGFAAIEGIILGVPIMSLFHGETYAQGGIFLFYQGIGTGLFVLSSVLGGILVGIGAPRYSALSQVLGLLIMIGTEIFLVQEFGAIGGAVALVIGGLVAFPLGLVFVKRKKIILGMDLWPKYMVVIALTILVTWMVPANTILMLIVAFIVAILLGLLFIAIFGLVEKKDLESALKTVESLKGGMVSFLLKVYGRIAASSPFISDKEREELLVYLKEL